MAFHVPEADRVRQGPMKSDASYGNNGAFILNVQSSSRITPVHIIASDGEGWEHVSVSLRNRTPTWDEMCYVKDLFWDPEDVVVQFHPKRSEYVNVHPNCLHLWRPNDGSVICTPPPRLIG